MIPDRILRKIERCLALTRSANEHEAGIALRQAQRMMAEHGLTTIDVAAARIDRATARSESGRTPPQWLARLASLVNAAFGTLAVYEPRPTFDGWQGYYAFLGPDSQARIAAYAFEVLQRQLVNDRRSYMATISKRAKRETKTRRADAFAMAWVSGAYAHIVPIEQSEEALEAIEHFKARYYTTLESLCAIDRGQRREDQKAMMAGYQTGRNARLHTAVAQDRKEALTHG